MKLIIFSGCHAVCTSHAFYVMLCLACGTIFTDI